MSFAELFASWLTSDPEAAQRDIDAELCRRSLAEFFRQSWHVLEPDTPLDDNWHIDAICDHIQALFEGWASASETGGEQLYQDLLINVPPGTLKSRILGVHAQPWAWTRWPHFGGLFLSSNPRVSLRDADLSRVLIGSEWYQTTFKLEWSIDPANDAKGLYKNTRGGWRQSQGLTAKVTGDRHDGIFVDDPHDAQQVHSRALRDEVNDKWDNAIANRLKDPKRSIRCGIMQRLHAGDWAAKRMAEGWAHLVIRQERRLKDNKATPLGWVDPRTTEGELVFPARFSAKYLAAERLRLGSDGYAGQHQQEPVPEGGGKFKTAWFVYWERVEGLRDTVRMRYPDGRTKVVKYNDCRWFVTADIAASTKQSADWTVLSVWAVTHEGEMLLIDLVRGRMETPDIVPAMKTLLALYPKIAYFAVESNGLGLGVIQTARRANLAVRGVESDADKLARAQTALIACEAGQIAFPAQAAWLADFLLELTTFNNADHDDQVDTVSLAAIDVFRLGGAKEPEEDRVKRLAAEQEAKSAAWRSIDNDYFFT